MSSLLDQHTSLGSIGFALIFGALLLLPLTAVSTILKPHSVESLTHEADLIAVIQVEGHQSLRDGPRNFIYTDHTVLLEEVVHTKANLKEPKANTQMILRQIGGRIGDVEQSVVGIEDIRKGDRWIAFLKVHEGRIYFIGMHQGAWYLDPSDRVRPSRALKDRNAPDAIQQSKSTFLNRVRAALKGARL